MSLYYEAEREQPLTEQEDSMCREIVERYCARYPFEEKYEDFRTYDIDKATNNKCFGRLYLDCNI